MLALFGAAAATAQERPAETIQQLVITGNAIGVAQSRANVKITLADLESYPPGVSADKILERVSGIQLGSSNAFGGDGFESTINMRGFGKDSIGFSVDGIPNGRTTLGGGSVPTRYFDSANLAGVDVAQSAGVIGAPSHQALVGHINYITQDPERRFGLRAEAALGSAEYRQLFARIDSGEFAPGFSAYLSASRQQWVVSYVDDPAGRNQRDHVDVKLVGRFAGGAVFKLRSGYNNRREESGTNIVTLARFNTQPGSDGYTDRWTGVPNTDRNYRLLKGNPREDGLTSADLLLPLAANLRLQTKLYHHRQEGIGKESSLGNAGFPGLDGRAASLYFRANNYAMNRNGAVFDLSGKSGGAFADWLDWRVGAWVERYRRAQVRNWHAVLDEAVGPEWDPVASTTSEDKHWDNRATMLYAGNRSSFLGGRLKVDAGVTYLANKVDYTAPIHDSRTNRLNQVNRADLNSGVLPKLGAVLALAEKTEVFAGLARNAATVTDATLEGGSASTLAAAQTLREMDQADALDIGLRHRGGNYSLGVQGFWIDSKETVAADIVGTLQSENVDQGRRIRGVEITAGSALGNLKLHGAVTFQKHAYKLDAVDAQGYPARGFIRSGAPLVGIADRNAFAEAVWYAGETLRLALNLRHISSRPGYYANPRVAGSGVDERLPAHTLVGLSARCQFDRFSLGLNVENATDKRYISGIAPELLTSPSTVGRYFIGAPRTFTVWAKAEL